MDPSQYENLSATLGQRLYRFHHTMQVLTHFRLSIGQGTAGFHLQPFEVAHRLDRHDPSTTHFLTYDRDGRLEQIGLGILNARHAFEGGQARIGFLHDIIDIGRHGHIAQQPAPQRRFERKDIAGKPQGPFAARFHAVQDIERASKWQAKKCVHVPKLQNICAARKNLKSR